MMDTSEPQPTPGEIAYQMATLFEIIQVLDKSTTSLRDQLEPILSADFAEKAGSTPREEPTSPFARQLYDQVVSLENIIHRLDNISSRIQL